jgi:hypothetical protein
VIAPAWLTGGEQERENVATGRDETIQMETDLGHRVRVKQFRQTFKSVFYLSFLEGLSPLVLAPQYFVWCG